MQPNWLVQQNKCILCYGNVIEASWLCLHISPVQFLVCKCSIDTIMTDPQAKTKITLHFSKLGVEIPPSLVSPIFALRSSPAPVFDHLQHTKSEEGQIKLPSICSVPKTFLSQTSWKSYPCFYQYCIWSNVGSGNGLGMSLYIAKDVYWSFLFPICRSLAFKFFSCCWSQVIMLQVSDSLSWYIMSQPQLRFVCMFPFAHHLLKTGSSCVV